MSYKDNANYSLSQDSQARMSEHSSSAPEGERVRGERLLFCFDFDGTTTSKDSFVEFIRFVCGAKGVIYAFGTFMPLLVLMKLKLYPNWKAKEKVITHCFGGMKESDFNNKAVEFAKMRKDILRPKAIETMKKAHEEGADVMIVSASAVNWVKPFFAEMPWVEVIGTELEVKDGVITGRLSTPNCYGEEKVKRILQEYPNRKDYYLVAYGDSGGDKQMLAFADEAHFKPFRD